jgi:hypothetical protein
MQPLTVSATSKPFTRIPMAVAKFSQILRATGMLWLGLPGWASANDAVTIAAWQRLHTRSAETLAEMARQPAVEVKGADDVAEISFQEFLAPAREGGLEYSERLRALAGKRVRLSGYMVREPRRSPGIFILVPRPVTLERNGLCFTEDIPPHAVHVHVAATGAPVPYVPGRMVLTGVIEIGPRNEVDGRRSAVRLRLNEKEAVSAPGGGAAAASP